ncbi:CidA/LrgA family protein [Paenibacillus sp.]|uniref:CidA/LrgA family protein n=1 Tax=Paenibacillus sp. TaxID=58172 RepID=UPI002D4A59CA|nr:CidA/LrgA family protein [Paenibacillus sp.]HZG55146.1 CidA/LrgA family protein [Paenibacillus sp.]
MRGLAVLLGFHLAGTALERLAGVPLPGNVIGLLLLLAALLLGWVKLEWVESTAQFLLKHMMLFFAPIVVGTIAFLPLIRAEWAAIVVSLLLGPLIVVVATALAAKLWPRAER